MTTTTSSEMATRKLFPIVDDGDPHGLIAHTRAYLEWMLISHHSSTTIETRERELRYVVAFFAERSITRPVDVTRQACERYQRYLFHYRKSDGKPLSMTSQKGRLSAMKSFFRWATRRNLVLFNPASEIEMRRSPIRLPRAVLTIPEVERVLSLPDLSTSTGLRDRAMLETFYSTGVRRSELAGLELRDVDVDRRTVLVRQGKGKKDRILPIGERAAAFITKYLDEARPFLVVDDVREVFVREGLRFKPDQLTQLVARYVERADIGKLGSCHLFRHTMATLMLEGGADIRFIQAMLGHADLTTTEIYTRVSILKLQEVHAATHPSSKLARTNTSAAELLGVTPEELLARIDEEADEEADDVDVTP